MGNKFRTEEQRLHWNEYNNDYASKHYKTICLKLNKDTDKDVLEVFATYKSPTEAVRHLVRDKK